ncbi:MAG: DUF485 domain-containing protein [Clostridia bacterium]
MSHGPSTEWKKDNAADIKTKLGLTMVFIYTLIYASFILINVRFPKLMSFDIGSLNLAIVYGFGLIVIALIQAVVYNHICTRSEEKFENENKAANGEDE